MLPDFIIVGAEKAGTTWLHEALALHPGVFLPQVKELHYFNRFDSNLNEIDNFARRPRSWYEAFFEPAPAGSVKGEVTPLYLPDPEAPGRIHEMLPDVKIIISLRNPVGRAYSHYQMARAKAHLTEDLDAVIAGDDARILQRGLYAAQVQTWIDMFGADRVHVVLFEELVADPVSGLGEIAAFLDIDPSPLQQGETPGKSNAAATYRSAAFYNASVKVARGLRNFGATRALADALKASGLYDRIKAANRKEAAYEPLSPEHRARLVDYYRADVARLAGLLGRETLPWKDFQTEDVQPVPA